MTLSLIESYNLQPAYNKLLKMLFGDHNGRVQTKEVWIKLGDLSSKPDWVDQHGDSEGQRPFQPIQRASNAILLQRERQRAKSSIIVRFQLPNVFFSTVNIV